MLRQWVWIVTCIALVGCGTTAQQVTPTPTAIPAAPILASIAPVSSPPASPVPATASSASSASNLVTTCAKSGPGSLPDVFAAAAANATITFMRDCTGPTAITLTDTLTATRDVTINAGVPLHAVTISGGRSDVHLFSVESKITLSLRGVTLANGDNSHLQGGAIINSGTLNVVGCIFSDNAAALGGAIANSGTLNVVNSTFSGNSAPVGGAIYNTGTLNVVGSTFTGNSARGAAAGGAILNFGSGTLSLALSVVSGNTSARSGPNISGAVTTDGGGNVVGDTRDSIGLTAPNDRLNVDPLLAPLASNVGPVRAFAVKPGSPAIDIAPCPIDPITTKPLASDALGSARPQGANCDAGSYEAATRP